MDIICALMGIIGTSPLWIIGIVGIMISDPGPIFYMANRVGQNNKIFKMFKFRSMRVDKNANENGFKADTNRIFAFGEFIRRSKIDELPQLLNILFGDMSVVGPRPASVDQENMLLQVVSYLDLQARLPYMIISMVIALKMKKNTEKRFYLQDWL